MNHSSHTRRSFLKSICLTTAAAALPGPALYAAREGRNRGKDRKAALPNIVFLFADDLGYGDVAAFNPDSKNPTPNIDSIAARGIRFTDAHSAGSTCVPSRYGLITGQYLWRNKLRQAGNGGYADCIIEKDRTTIASLLKDNGYRTGCVGKWHLGLGEHGEKTDYTKPITHGPNQIGFDYFFGMPASLDIPPYVYIENDRPTAPLDGTIGDSETPGARWAAGKFWRGGPIAGDFRHDEVLDTFTGKAVDFINDSAGKRKPFFLYLPFTAPHTPWMPAKKYIGTSGAGEYGDFVAHVDACVGRVLKAIDKNNVTGDTLIFFASDNGAFWIDEEIAQYDHRANGKLRGQKGDIWEGGHHMPLIASWPGKVPQGKTSDQMICFTDMLATFAALTGDKLGAGAGADSFSFLPVLLGKENKTARNIMIHQTGTGYAIRQDQWKLITFLGSGGFTKPKKVEPKPGDPIGQLYNLSKDPAETKNLYLSNPEMVTQLTKRLNKYLKQSRTRPDA